MKTKIAMGTLAVAAMLSAVSAVEAAATNVYVTVSGAGDMDGRDWDNGMKSLTAAYAICAENAAGGTVHMAGGFYRSNTGNFAANAAIVQAPNVKVVGGCDDKETILWSRLKTTFTV